MRDKKREILAGFLGLTLLLSACGQSGDSSVGSTANAPVAEIEGEVTSPDGRFRVETAGKTDTYVSGVLVPEFLRVVDTGTGETVWEEDGYAWQSVSWSQGEPALAAVAYGGRTWQAVTVVNPETGASWDFTLPDGSPIPEYTFLPEDWCRWVDDIHADITVGREDGKQPETFRCVFADPEGALEGSSFLLTEEALPGTYDFDRDGTEETVYLQTLEGSDGFLCYQETGSQTIENGIEWTVALREGDETLWQREGFSTAHVGWGSLFACQVDGQDYLLSYTPYMGQGWLFFQYQLFSLTEDGQPVILAEESLSYDCNDNAEPKDRMDPAAMATFLQRVHGYLENATLLLSTEGGAWHKPGSSGAEFWDDYAVFWNEDYGLYDESLTLEENLKNSWALRGNRGPEEAVFQT